MFSGFLIFFSEHDALDTFMCLISYSLCCDYEIHHDNMISRDVYW